ncbi:MAG: SMP-30/gluconolactonase/LRE family protein [Alphaproteobacteria bacterium]|nr:SMP-30/gluconolactonase/LRE family protein [Alphaproteobacteria bacterium]
MAGNPIDGFEIDPEALETIGHDLQRPECILAERDGTLWSADARGGVVKIAPDGSQEIITQDYARDFTRAADDTDRFTKGTLPNGLAFDAAGNILISNFGTDCLERMTRDGKTELLLDTIEGKPIGKVNFVLRDRKDRIWMTVSTRIVNWMEAVSPKIADGYIVLIDDKGPRIVTDGLAFTNEVRLDDAEEWLYIVETCGQRISRMRVAANGDLSAREVYGPSKLGVGGFPDGITFDAHGNLWGTLVMADVIFAITPDGDYRVLLDDGDDAKTAELEAAFRAEKVTADHMLAATGTIAPWMASITFGGPDLKTGYIGSLRGTRIPYFQSPVAGQKLAHW